ncbi:carbohydrate-binding domain-containing protein [Chryseolinea sp. T2]|uniref:carbohydrate-binding domain-containing protein n=1 Tax=Chryseolinea sp. T2 TaxID=3129255 RepID=UPI003077AEC7
MPEIVTLIELVASFFRQVREREMSQLKSKTTAQASRYETPAAIYLMIIFIYALSAMRCSSNDEVTPAVTEGESVAISAEYVPGISEGLNDNGSDDDDLIENSTFDKTVLITFGSPTEILNPLQGAGVEIADDNGDVIITSTIKGVAYELSGITSNGSVKIYSDNKFKLTLNGVQITNSDGPAINIQSSKTAFVVLADGTENGLTDGKTYATSSEDMKGTFFSEGQLVFSGAGSLTVIGNYKHGIVSDDYIRVRSGNIEVAGAATDGIHANEAFIADGGTFKISAASDGIDCEEGHIIINAGDFNFNVADDGIAASYEDGDESIDPYVTINGGKINVISTEGEGIESKSTLTINDGTITTTTTDDGLNAGKAININGGMVYSYSAGNDGMDSNGTFTITGGIVIAIGASGPEAGIDCDARTLAITGGIVVGIGGATSAPSQNASSVPSVIMGAGKYNQLVSVVSTDGTHVVTFLAPTAFNTMLIGGSRLELNKTYTIFTGGEVVDGTEFNGLYTGGTYVTGDAGGNFTTGNIVTQLGGSVSRG